MRIPPTSKPVIDQRPSYTPAVKQEVSSMPSSQWMPIVPEQQPAAPAVQEMSVVFELPTESPVQAPAPIPALPSTGRLPLVPLVFRVPSTSGPAVQTWEGPISSGAWSGPEDTPQLPQAQMQDQSALSQGFNDDPSSWGAWPGQEEAVVPPPPPAQTQEPSALPEGTNEPLGPPGTFLPLPGDLNAPVQNPDGQPQPPSVDSWPDTPTDVPGVQLIPPLAPATFGQFAVPPAG